MGKYKTRSIQEGTHLSSPSKLNGWLWFVDSGWLVVKFQWEKVVWFSLYGYCLGLVHIFLEEGFFFFFWRTNGADRLVYCWLKLDESCVLTHFLGWFGPFGRIVHSVVKYSGSVFRR